MNLILRIPDDLASRIAAQNGILSGAPSKPLCRKNFVLAA